MINEKKYLKIKENWDNLVKPLDSLGAFEEITCRLGALLDDESVNIDPVALLVFCSDNGVVEEEISQSREDVTYKVTKLLGSNQSSVCHMASVAGIDVYPINLGVKESSTITGVDNSFYISPSTKNFAKEPAMSPSELQKAMDAGARYVEALFDKGYHVFLLGEMGIGNTTTSSAIIAALNHLPAAKVCGKGSGLSDEGLQKKIRVIDDAIAKYDLYNQSAVSVLGMVGGYDIAAMVGAILKARELSVPIILDGLITAAAALVATAIDVRTKDVLFFSHKGRETGIMLVADSLGMSPVIDANLALGEGTGAVMFISMLRTAKAVYDGNTSFKDAEVEAYKRFV